MHVRTAPPRAATPHRPPLGRARSLLLIALAACVCVVALALARTLRNAPPPATPEPPLAPVKFAHFNYAHPRLPHPAPGDAERLRRENPAYLNNLRSRVQDGHPNPKFAIEAALLLPGLVDMDALYERLIGLKVIARGDGEVGPLAQAYDWLHDRWTPQQRAGLLHKLLDGCEYEIRVIRENALSPYNVYLYNAPYQALTACAIASYGDDPRAEPVMRFTRHFWTDRIVPVWKQIMGQNGGWHEGKEYVGIGIGRAAYTLPAMWRAATGEDWFKAIPGLAGLTDFLVYRRRPDHEVFRLGDGSFFTGYVPEQRALAMEFGHAAAFTEDEHKWVEPTAWPWGPLPDKRLYDPQARARLPLTRWFDGIGVLIARGGWGPDDSFVWFKAGNNYWSHTQLDVGHFDIYKGGALAIDSGLNYGVDYGHDHHMNYSYQSIAHNVITVTDPRDTVPQPGQRPRPVANDGGQRRIGSGWGKSAPMSLTEWQADRDTYVTARVLGRQQLGDIELISADLSSAFTNSKSGSGDFSARTRRVERWYRSFGYDPVDEVVVVFDHVRASRAAFRKRWLLHTSEQPTLTREGFAVRAAAENKPGRAGGQLRGVVLWPTAPAFDTVGGPGREFWVDGKNYDDEGRIAALLADKRKNGHHSEPGAWRLELSPAAARADDDFLVVMLPRRAGQPAPPHQVRRLDTAAGPAVEIAGPRHTTRWYFDRQSGRGRVEIVSSR